MSKYLVIAVLLMGSVAFPAEAGSPDGRHAWSTRVEAYSDVVYRVTFFGDEIAEFAIHGDGDTDVDIFVYDSRGRLVAQDVNLIDVARVRWYPQTTQSYRIVIRNLGNVWNRVGMSHN